MARAWATLENYLMLSPAGGVRSVGCNFFDQSISQFLRCTTLVWGVTYFDGYFFRVRSPQSGRHTVAPDASLGLAPQFNHPSPRMGAKDPLEFPATRQNIIGNLHDAPHQLLALSGQTAASCIETFHSLQLGIVLHLYLSTSPSTISTLPKISTTSATL